MPFTVNKKFSVQTSGANPGNWGTGSSGNDLNSGFIGLADQALAGVSFISQASGTYNLTFTVGGGGDVSNGIFIFTAAPLLGNLTVTPAGGDATTYFNGFYVWDNRTTGAFTVTLQTASGSVVLPQNRCGLFYVSAVQGIGPRIVAEVANSGASSNADVLPAGTNVLFLQSGAPTGWTQNVSLNDYALRLVNTAGAGTHGSTVFSTVFNQTATGNYTLQIADIPSHTHDVKFNLAQSPYQSAGGNVPVVNIVSNGTSTGSGAAIATGGSGPHQHSFSMQPLYVDVINASRN